MNLGWVLMFVLWVLVALVLVAATLGNGVGEKDSTARVPSGVQWLRSVASTLDALDGHSVEYLSPHVVQVRHDYRPAWAYLVAVIFFPFGLVALLHRSTVEGTIVIVDEGPPTTVRFRGRFSDEAIGAVNATIPDEEYVGT